jgi:hypothetical protein
MLLLDSSVVYGALYIPVILATLAVDHEGVAFELRVLCFPRIPYPSLLPLSLNSLFQQHCIHIVVL